MSINAILIITMKLKLNFITNRAEKKFKKILKNLNEDPMDLIKMETNGYEQCKICGTSFEKRKEILEHLEEVHNINKEGADFEASSSDVSMHEEDESSESEGSSAEVSSEIETVNEDEVSNDSINVSNRQGKLPTTESQEIKNSRKLITSYTEQYYGAKPMAPETIKRTQEL